MERRGFLGMLMAAPAALAASKAAKASEFVERESKLLVPKQMDLGVEADMPLAVAESAANVSVETRKQYTDRFGYDPFYWDTDQQDPAVYKLTAAAYAGYVAAHRRINQMYQLEGARVHELYI